ncbi:MAG: hypothetical protein AAF488_05895 [Planctomycetota bacterium]
MEPGNSHIWTIVERLYRSHHLYALQYQNYEAKVAEYVETLKIPRDKIRLPADELSRLLQFKQLERIRDRFLLPLKEACHALFRSDHSTDILDRLVNDIFHEISILKEEHYNVLTYAVQPESQVDREEQKAILDEVHELFPIKVHRLRHLFDLARNRVESVLNQYRDNSVLIRSLFLTRDGFVAKADPHGLVYFYCWMYGEDRPFDGYVTVGDSFFDSGFFDYAELSYAAGEEYLHGVPPGEKRRFDASWKEAREHLKRRIRECRSKLEALALDE